MGALPTQECLLAKQPLEKNISAERQTLQDLKSLLEDRGGKYVKNKENTFKRKVYDKDKEDRLGVNDYRLNSLDNKDDFPKYSDVNSNNFVRMCSELRFRKGRWCFNSFKTILFVLLVMAAFMESTTRLAEGRSAGNTELFNNIFRFKINTGKNRF